MQEKTVEHLASLLKSSGRKRPFKLFIGAGCSISAGIPDAKAIVRLIKSKYAPYYKDACLEAGCDTPGYAQCMNVLDEDERDYFINDIIENSTINNAHIGMACLIKSGYIDRALTVNFDPLISKACSLLNEFPPIYDFASNPEYRFGHIRGKAIFHLHGQTRGIKLLHSDDEIVEHANKISEGLADSLRGERIIVAGYSGSSDKLFPILAKNGALKHSKIWWLSYDKKKLPAEIIRTFSQEKVDLFHIPDCDADKIFPTLGENVRVFPPEILKQPFTHLKNTLENIGTRRIGRDGESEAAGHSHAATISNSLVRKAIEKIEKPHHHSFQAEIYQDQANISHKKDKIPLLKSACKEYQLAAKANKTDPLTFMSWGGALGELSLVLPRNEAHSTFEQAIEKFLISERLDNSSDSLYTLWGVSLIWFSKRVPKKERSVLLLDSIAKSKQANKMDPESWVILNNWGVALLELAAIAPPDKRETMLAQAEDKLEEACDLSDGSFANPITHLSQVLLRQHELNSGELALLYRAQELLEEAEELNSIFTDYYMARLYAVRGDFEGAMFYLEDSSYFETLPDKVYFHGDSFFSDLRKNTKFKPRIKALWS